MKMTIVVPHHHGKTPSDIEAVVKAISMATPDRRDITIEFATSQALPNVR